MIIETLKKELDKDNLTTEERIKIIDTLARLANNLIDSEYQAS